MKSPEVALRAASLIAALICAVHLLRFVLEIPVMIGSLEVSPWPSGMIVVVAGMLSVWFWQLARHRTNPPPRA